MKHVLWFNIRAVLHCSATLPWYYKHVYTHLWWLNKPLVLTTSTIKRRLIPFHSETSISLLDIIMIMLHFQLSCSPSTCLQTSSLNLHCNFNHNMYTTCNPPEYISLNTERVRWLLLWQDSVMRKEQ